MQLNKPKRTPNHPTKSHVVKINDNGTERLIRFGQQGVSTAGKPKKGESKKQKARRKSFKARHAKNIAKGKTSAAYWANKVKWNEGGRVLGVTGDDPLSEAMTGTLGQFRTTQDRNPRTVAREKSTLADVNDDGYIDILDAYEFLRPSYPTEIAGALKQAGSNISQGDIAKGMAMAGLGTFDGCGLHSGGEVCYEHDRQTDQEFLTGSRTEATRHFCVRSCGLQGPTRRKTW